MSTIKKHRKEVNRGSSAAINRHIHTYIFFYLTCMAKMEVLSNTAINCVNTVASHYKLYTKDVLTIPSPTAFH